MLAMTFLFVVFVVIVKVAEVAPAATVTFAGTVARAGLLLVSAMVAPPAGAALLSFTVPVEGDPPTTVVGLRLSDDSTAGAAGIHRQRRGLGHAGVCRCNISRRSTD